MYYIGVPEEKNENLKKEGKMRMSILIFIYTIHFDYLKVWLSEGVHKIWKHWLQ